VTPYLQLLDHDPENGVIGDCWRTAIGCLLNMPPEDVPHFCDGNWQDGPAVERNTRAWLATKGYSFVEIPYKDTVENVLAMCAAMYKDVYYIISGRVGDGPNHATIGYGGEILWDPSANGEDAVTQTITNPCDDGYVWLLFLIPLIITGGYQDPK
jgi:hypothetical protein